MVKIERKILKDKTCPLIFSNMYLFLLFVRNAYLKKNDKNPHGLAVEDEDDDNDDDLCTPKERCFFPLPLPSFTPR